jgi:hypothetical protein
LSKSLFETLLKQDIVPPGPLTLGIQYALARTSYDTGVTKPLPESIDRYQKLVRLQTSAVGADHRDTLRSRSRLAWALHHWGDAVDAYRQLTQVLATQRALFGEDHRDTLESMSYMAWFSWWRRQYEISIVWFEQTLVGCRRVLGPAHPRTVKCIAGLAWCYDDMGRPDISLLEEALQASKRIFGLDDKVYTDSTATRLNRLYLRDFATGRKKHSTLRVSTRIS